MKFGKGVDLWYLSAHKISASLGPPKSRVLQVLHALTRYDTGSTSNTSTIKQYGRHRKHRTKTTYLTLREETISSVTQYFTNNVEIIVILRLLLMYASIDKILGSESPLVQHAIWGVYQGYIC